VSATAPSGGGGDVALPAALAPLGERAGQVRDVPGIGPVRGLPTEFARLVQPIYARPGTPTPVVQACRQGIVAAARPYGVVRVDAASAGAARRGPGGDLIAPVEMRMVYARAGGYEARQARVTCRIDARTGRVAFL
jgi:hypothetical protein